MAHEYNSDQAVLDLLRRGEPLRISELATAMEVTATAVRQRLNRLMASGLVTRTSQSSGRGRPSHRYELTPAGRRATGSNFTDLAVALWQEMCAITDPTIRRGLLKRLSRRLAALYAHEVEGETVRERMHSIALMLQQREVPFEVTAESDQDRRPVLKALGCPYTEVAEQDRSICAMERMLFSELLGQGLSLSQCRLDGESCCTFELN